MYGNDKGGKFDKFEDDNDIDNKQIDLKNKPVNQQVQNRNDDIDIEQANNQQNQQINAAKGILATKFGQQMKDHSDEIVAGMIVRENSNVSEKISMQLTQKLNSYLQFFGQYFNVEVDDIKNKLKASINPANKDFHTLAEANPDLYGPFWIYTTLILLVTFVGNFSNYLAV